MLEDLPMIVILSVSILDDPKREIRSRVLLGLLISVLSAGYKARLFLEFAGSHLSKKFRKTICYTEKGMPSLFLFMALSFQGMT